MCGICGIANLVTGRPVQSAVLANMLNQLIHRGPDDGGTYCCSNVGLSARRLSIIDLDGGKQPVSNEACNIWLVLNGEIWNYRQLRETLRARGHIFRTECDSEVIVHAYEEYGTDCFARLHGMFALALWDERRQHFLLARDRQGKKPLYYTRVNGDLLFASEIKSLLYDPRVQRTVDAQALADSLSIRYVPGPATLFRGIYKFPQAHWLLYTADQWRCQKYWHLEFSPQIAPARRSLVNYQAEIRRQITRAVEERMMADVPIGAFLSGGINSSIIVGEMSRHQSVKTFAVGFAEPGYNELPYARLVSEHFHTEHHEVLVSGEDLINYWPLLTWHQDEPMCEPSALAMFLVARLARQHVTVALSGEGGDELFAGYPKYVLDSFSRYYQLLPEHMRNTLMAPILERLPYFMRKLSLAALALNEPVPRRWINWFGTFSDSLKRQLLTPAWQSRVEMDAGRIFSEILARSPQPDDLASMLYLDTVVWLPDDLLMKNRAHFYQSTRAKRSASNATECPNIIDITTREKRARPAKCDLALFSFLFCQEQGVSPVSTQQVVPF